ncbi:MAG: hypothetical protein K0S68_585 [Candidatus Saccharibacteria bacterium]|jgi:hypothetical protein|nr:hypothetical protein [Candidatus Saccharibacteria bacterium]
MNSLNERDNLDRLYGALTQALAKATVGDYSGEIEIDPDNHPRVNEVLVGVQVLLDVINEQAREIEQLKAQNTTNQDHRVTLLDEVLNRSAD